MSKSTASAQIIELQPKSENITEKSNFVPIRADLLEIKRDGSILVCVGKNTVFSCDWLEVPATAGIKLEPGDRLLVVPPADGENGVVLGRIGRYQEPKPEANVVIEASETLTLKCGEASVDLRNDGKVMVRGEDVLLRAKGTQRIRAGTVAIN